MSIELYKGFMHLKDGTKIYYEKSSGNNPKCSIIILHGICEHLGRYDTISNQLNIKQYNVYRFDFRGHGRSDGKEAYIDNYNCFIEDLDVMVDLVKDENKDAKLFILGHSFGGLISLAYQIKHSGKVNGFILSAPTVSDEAGTIGNFDVNAQNTDYIPNNLGHLICSDKNVVQQYFDDAYVHNEMTVGIIREMRKAIEWVKNNIEGFEAPIIIIHGENDQIVSYLDSEELYECISSADKKLLIYSCMYHEVLNEKSKDKVIDDLSEWIDERL
jgi:lysophospholipase